MFKNDSDKLDQHFLIDDNIVKTFIKEANLSRKDTVVEIGPGKGQLTTNIAPKINKLICIELDKRLEPYLSKIQKEYKNIEVIYGSVLDTFIPECNKIVTALPYSIIEPFINKLIKCRFEELLMITGKKYASSVKKKSINKLSLLTNCYFKCEYIMDIMPEAFEPAPRTVSSMIKLIPQKAEEIKEFNILMFRFMFYYRDKKIRNALIESLIRTSEINGTTVTQRIAKQFIDELNLKQDLLEKVFSTCSNDELVELDNYITKLNELLLTFK